jgi:phosphoribosyl 1,2-cyclic phosphodiesterase
VKRAAGALTLTFLGTRGEIDVRSRRHRRHSSLLVQRDAARIMIDCGTDWRGRLHSVAPTAIVLTHAHPDHAAGLAEGAPCPVYATKETWNLIHRFPIKDRRRLPLRKSFMIDGMRFQAFPVDHSIRAPAVGYRVSVSGARFLYVPDVARLPDEPNALRGITIYIGDGATMKRSMVRRKGRTVIGHASIASQLGWCEATGVRHAIFTHCGSPIVRGDGRMLTAALRQLGREHGVEARFACDGDSLRLPDDGRRCRSSGHASCEIARRPALERRGASS